MGKRIRRALFMSDQHAPNHDKAAIAAALEYLASDQPDVLVLGGDFSDFELFSRHTRQMLRIPTYGEIAEASNDLLDRFQAAAGGAQIYFLEGNHDYWPLRWTANANEHLGDVLEVTRMLQLKKRGVTFIPMHSADRPGSYRTNQSNFSVGPVYCHHGFATGINAARTTSQRNPGRHQMFGHGHKFQSYESGGFGPGQNFVTMMVPCLSTLRPLWMQGRPNDWTHGFGEFWWDSRNQNRLGMACHRIRNGTLVLGDGRIFGRGK